MQKKKLFFKIKNSPVPPEALRPLPQHRTSPLLEISEGTQRGPVGTLDALFVHMGWCLPTQVRIPKGEDYSFLLLFLTGPSTGLMADGMGLASLEGIGSSAFAWGTGLTWSPCQLAHSQGTPHSDGSSSGCLTLFKALDHQFFQLHVGKTEALGCLIICSVSPY